MRKLKGKYILACSGGPDSMALLNMCLNSNIEVAVCHVNYHKRRQANTEERYVKNFCLEHKIKCFVLDKKYKCTSNFQDFARKYRYDFFYETLKKYKYDGILIAHNLDDLVETYYMQQEKGVTTTTSGLRYKTVYKDTYIYRPLLNKEKSELQNYCDLNKVKYFIDSSNLTDHYHRNYVRHNITSKYSKKEKLDIKKKCDLSNKEKDLKIKEVNRLLKGKTKLSIDAYLKFKDYDTLLRTLINFNLTNRYVEELNKQLRTSSNMITYKDNKLIIKEYDYIEVIDKPLDYCITLNKLEYINNEYFKITNNGKTIESLTLNKDDYPIKIRNYHSGDKISLRFGTKKVSRFLIDRKIPYKDRLIWPVIENSKGDIIFVKGIGSDKRHYSNKPTLFMV